MSYILNVRFFLFLIKFKNFQKFDLIYFVVEKRSILWFCSGKVQVIPNDLQAFFIRIIIYFIWVMTRICDTSPTPSSVWIYLLKTTSAVLKRKVELNISKDQSLCQLRPQNCPLCDRYERNHIISQSILLSI